MAAGPADPAEHRELIAARASTQRRRRSVLLRGELHTFPAPEAFTEEAPVQVRLLIAGADVSAGVGRRVVYSPRPRIDPHFRRAALDSQFLERPEPYLRQIENSARAWIDLVVLDTVEENTHAANVALKRRHHR